MNFFDLVSRFTEPPVGKEAREAEAFEYRYDNASANLVDKEKWEEHNIQESDIWSSGIVQNDDVPSEKQVDPVELERIEPHFKPVH